jgi:hypothetical protein
MPHGKFLSWARSEFGWTPKHVQNHLKLAANAKRVSRLGPGASLRMALAAIKESQQVETAKGKLSEASQADESPILPRSFQRVTLIGEIEEGTLDCEKLADELERIAAALGAPKTKWKVRLSDH